MTMMMMMMMMNVLTERPGGRCCNEAEHENHYNGNLSPRLDGKGEDLKLH